MESEITREFRSIQIKKIGLLAIGFCAAAMLYWLLLSQAHTGTITGTITALQNGLSTFDGQLEVLTSRWTLLLALLSTVTTVLFYEILKVIVEWVGWLLSIRRHVVNFFGTDAVSRTGKAAFILPKGRSTGTGGGTGDPRPPRDKKARTWINACDSAAARHILRDLVRNGLEAPMPQPIGGEEQPETKDAPFEMHFGLAARGETRFCAHAA